MHPQTKQIATTIATLLVCGGGFRIIVLMPTSAFILQTCPSKS